MSQEDGVLDQEVLEEALIRALEGPARRFFVTPEGRELAGYIPLDWRQRLLGHPAARLFIHRDYLVTTYPDGRMRVSGPRRGA
jgi:hypothetical protein